jgi:L,D-transpeptidase catalytic domain
VRPCGAYPVGVVPRLPRPHLDSPPGRRRRARRVAVTVALCCGATVTAAGCGSDGQEAIVRSLDGQTVTVPVQPSPTSTARAQPQGVPGAPPTGAATSAAEPRAADTPGTADPSPVPEAGAGSRPQASAAQTAPQPTVHVTRSTALRSRPGGPVIGRIVPRTEFGSPTVLAVVRQSGSWLGVVTSTLPNGRIGWISARAALEAHSNAWRIDASLRRREVVVRRDGRIVSRFPVAIGAPSTPTPRGRFAVTDKLLTTSATSPYGCCILALSGHQSSTPQGWGGGDRIAIHATNLPETIGTEASVGCLRAPTEAIRRVVRTVPLGTIVVIRA